MREDKMNIFVCFIISSSNKLCEGFAPQEHNTATEQLPGRRKIFFTFYPC